MPPPELKSHTFPNTESGRRPETMRSSFRSKSFPSFKTPPCGRSCMLSSPRPPACIGPISGLILPSNPSDVFRSPQNLHAPPRALVDKPRQNLSRNRNVIGVQLPSERRSMNKAQAFQGFMSEAMKKAQLKVRINNPASAPPTGLAASTRRLNSCVRSIGSDTRQSEKACRKLFKQVSATARPSSHLRECLCASQCTITHENGDPPPLPPGWNPSALFLHLH
jgi:hypothetical protein